jgi:beta-1,4-mannosyl-glycoprotein beta-1,4-N-acetylglucosaminyltransferase
LVEANTTFTSIPKPFYFEKNKARYAKYLDKIIHVKVEDMPGDPDAWVNDRFQRNSINRGLESADDNDVIVVSDLDELVRPETVQQLRTDVENQIWGLRMPLFYFKFNHMLITTESRYMVWGMACRKKLLVPADTFRFQRFQLASLPYNYNHGGIRMMEHAGWQFSYLGNNDFAKNKIKSFAHQETNTDSILEKIDVETSVQKGYGLGLNAVEKFVNIRVDDYMPKALLKNLDKYSHYLATNDLQDIQNLLPFQ